METLHTYVVEHDRSVCSDLDPQTQAIIEKMSRVAYVLGCHRQAVEKHSRQLVELQSALARMRTRR